MSRLAIAICVACQLLIVAGQIALKRAMQAGAPATQSKRHRLGQFGLGIGSMTVWFFLWLGLMRRYDLSQLFPFEGLDPAFIAVGAWLILKEKLPVAAWIGIGMVCAGIVVVARN